MANDAAQNDQPLIGVIGCGLMGSGIAEVCARKGLSVVVVEADAAAAASGQARVTKSLTAAASRGKITDEELAAAEGNLVVTDDWDALADRQVVIEAVSENLAMKTDIFRRVDALVKSADAVLASNTSSIPIIQLARVTERPEQVIGLHFFNPVPVLPLVELVPSLLTSEQTEAQARHLAAEVLGKNVIRSQDRAGFIVNALLIPYLLSAIRMVEAGFATAEDIDAGMVHGCAHPLGPLALTDLIGLDTTKAVAESLYEEFKEPLYAAPPLLNRMVEAGLLGRKSGRGFHEYGDKR